MPDREPIETTNPDTSGGSRPIPKSRPLELLSAGPFSTDAVLGVATAEPTRRRF